MAREQKIITSKYDMDWCSMKSWLSLISQSQRDAGERVRHRMSTPKLRWKLLIWFCNATTHVNTLVLHSGQLKYVCSGFKTSGVT